MDPKIVNVLNKIQLLSLFNEKDSSDKKNNREHFESVFYAPQTWPMQSIRDFWMIRYINRMRVTNFFFGNGAPLEVLIEMLSFYHTTSHENDQRFEQIKALWIRLTQANLPDYYYFSMHYGFELYLDGRKRTNGQPGEMVSAGNMFNTQEQHAENKYISAKENEALIRNRVAIMENERWEERQKLLESKRSLQSVLDYLKLKSIDDLFE